MSISYGLNVKPTDDPYIKTAEQGVHPLVAAAVPGAFLVDTLPLLKYVPEWMPGAGFKTKAREWKILARTMVEAPYAVTKQMMVILPLNILADIYESSSRLIGFLRHALCAIAF